MAEIMQYQKKRDDNPAFREALRKIWLSGFDDAPGYFNFFYEKRVRTGQAEIFCALVRRAGSGSRVFSARRNPPPRQCRRQKAYYGYAFAILPEYRGTGIYQKLAHAFFRFADAEKARNPFLPGERKAAPILYRKRHRSELYRAAGSIFGGRVCTDDRRRCAPRAFAGRVGALQGNSRHRFSGE